MASETGLRQLTDALQHLVDIDRLARDRVMVGERLHAIDEGDDAVGFVADQAGQLALGLIGILLEQLRRPANTGQRVFDLVRQHCRHRRDRSGGIAVGQLTIELVDHRALVQREHQRDPRLPLPAALPAP